MNNYTFHRTFSVNLETIKKLFITNQKINLLNLSFNLENKKIYICDLLFLKNKKIAKKLFVVKESYDENRTFLATKVLEYLIDLDDKGFGDITKANHVGRLKIFISWCDTNGYDLNNLSKEIAIQVFEYYTFHLKQQIRNSKYSQKSASYLQKNSLTFLVGLSNESKEEISKNITIIKSKKDTENKTTKSDNDIIKYSFNFYHALFLQIFDLVINQKDYPFKIQILNKLYWLLPYKKFWILSEHNTERFKLFDTSTGKIRPVEELEKLYAVHNSNMNTKRNDCIKFFKENNTNYNSESRLELANIGMKAYFMLFLTITGMNDSTASTLDFNDDFEVEKNNHIFKNIKYRANGKKVEFPIRSKFVKDFKKFVKIRKYLLKNTTYKKLFFEYKNQTINDYGKDVSQSSNFNRFFKKIDNNLPKLTSRNFRVNKINYNIEKYGVVHASQVAQTSIATVLSHYTGEFQESSAKQLNAYFEQMNLNILDNHSSSKEIAIGRCSKDENHILTDKEKTIPINANNIDINCNQSEGCLFCKYYCCHADQSDIQKLCSLLFVIDECRYIAKDETHFNSVYKIILDRVNNLLQYIHKNTNMDIELIKKDIYENENLHPYWEYKLTTLYNMGVLK